MGRELVLALLLAACRDDVCARHSDCGHDQVCSARGVCVAAPDGGLEEPAPITDAGIDADAAPDAPDGGP